MHNFAATLTPHDTYVEGVPHEIFRELRDNGWTGDRS
jgi:hypothetical protein